MEKLMKEGENMKEEQVKETGLMIVKVKLSELKMY